MQKAIEVIRLVSSETDRVILFHSASGKDSIALLNLMAPYFREIVCVYMYLVKDLAHINRYLNYAINKYPNARFVQVPHYGLGSYIQTGYMGCRQNPKQKKFSMTDITEGIRQNYGIQWAFFGFKQSDSMNRRIMLRGKEYELQAINRKTFKCYPLSAYHNNDVLAYIRNNNLIEVSDVNKNMNI